MQRWATVVVVILFGAACLEPVRETTLGQLPGAGGGGGQDAGQQGTGGGTADAGGGGTGSDGGPAVLPDAGFVARLANLDERRCNTRLPVPGACAVDGGECITFHRADGGVEEVATSTQVFSGSTFHYPLGLVGGGLAFVTYGVGGGSTLWHARPGAPPAIVQTTSDALQSVYGVADARPTYGFWYLAERYAGSPPMLTSRALMLDANLPPSGATAASATLPRPTSNAAANGSNYYVAFEDGLHSFYPAGGGLISAVGATDETIVALDVDDEAVVYLQCRAPWPTRCHVFRVDHRPVPQTRLLLATLDGLAGGVGPGVSIALLGGHVYVLGVQGLVRVPRAGGPVELVYRGEAFPQYGGTLQSGSLLVLGDKLYFGGICHFDADAPGYGTIELDPVARTARWLDDDPAYPFVPHVTPSGPAQYDRWWVASDGIYVHRR